MRIRPGEVLAGVAGAVLIGSLFATWYRYTLRGAGEVTALDGWEAFSVIDLLLALAGVLAVTLLTAQATSRSPALPIALSVLTALAGIVATLLVLVRILDEPGPDRFSEIAGGAWLGLAGALGVAAGGWWSMSDERNRRGPTPAVEQRPAPPA